jgi:hypothetical protein
LPFLSFGKLRGSYGTSGNDQITSYQFLSTYTSSSYSYEGISGLSPTRLTNPYFAWEIVKKMEGGIDLGFLKDRILVSGSYYRDRTGNQLVGYPLPYITGFSTVQYNLPAIIQNTGWEITVNSTNIKTANFSWTTTGNISIPENKLVSYPLIANSPYKNIYVVGQSIFIKKVYHNTGVDPQTGIYGFTTKNANGLPSAPQDQITSKPVTQVFYGGIENSLSFKGLRLDFLFQFVKQLGYDYRKYIYPPGTDNNNEPIAVLGRWQTTGNLTGVERFGVSSAVTNAYNSLQGSDGVITNASFVRLKNLALSYELPSSYKTKCHLKSARVYLQCQNLWTLTKYNGMDPEVGGLTLPPLRMITGGVQIGL